MPLRRDFRRAVCAALATFLLVLIVAVAAHLRAGPVVPAAPSRADQLLAVSAIRLDDGRDHRLPTPTPHLQTMAPPMTTALPATTTPPTTTPLTLPTPPPSTTHLTLPAPTAVSGAPRWINGHLCGHGCIHAVLPCAIPAYICQRESNYIIDVYNPTEDASGKYQFVRGTWNNFGGYRNAADAPEAVQDEKAREEWAGGAGCSHWSAC